MMEADHLLVVKRTDSVGDFFAQVSAEMRRQICTELDVLVDLPTGERVVFNIQAVDLLSSAEAAEGLH